MNSVRCCCLQCGQDDWQRRAAFWKCNRCGREYPCVNGVPRLCNESAVGPKDRELRDRFYNGLLGTYYEFGMPFLTMPARPARMSWRHWIAYTLIVASILALAIYLIAAIFQNQAWSPAAVTALILLGAICLFLLRHRHLFFLLLLAIPVKISITLQKFRASPSFLAIHEALIEDLQKRGGRLQVLDVSTGTCNSLYRHGWMKLDADYTAVDLSETMLAQGQRFMSDQKIPVNFILANAEQLPFGDDSFDVVLNYGALNGFTDPGQALKEMARVAKTNGIILFLDEQLYPSATAIEKLYFHKVLSSHNTIHRCPVELIPASIADVRVHQVYQFYYLCTGRKQ